MIDPLEHYIPHSMPQWGDFSTRDSLCKKVDQEGHLLPYVGNTVVFLLDDDTKAQLHRLQQSLYDAAGEMLAEPLQMSTFHMTLHDLANGVPDQQGLGDWMAYTQEQAARILSGWKDFRPIRMKATRLFNMVSTSIVLGLAPADEDSWGRLDEMYMTLEGVVNLGYALTPHITMGYFKPGTYSQEQVRRLNQVLDAVDLEITLYPENLVLQNFSDMNHYETVL